FLVGEGEEHQGSSVRRLNGYLGRRICQFPSERVGELEPEFGVIEGVVHGVSLLRILAVDHTVNHLEIRISIYLVGRKFQAVLPCLGVPERSTVAVTRIGVGRKEGGTPTLGFREVHPDKYLVEIGYFG